MNENSINLVGIINLVYQNKFSSLKKFCNINFKFLMERNILKNIIFNASDDVIEHIIHNGIYLNCINDNCSPSIIFCKYGKIKHLKLLLDNGADISIRGENNMSLLHFACRNNNYKMIRLLVERGINIEYSDDTGSRPIHYVCKYGNAKILKYFISKNADINVKDNDNTTPLLVACINGYYDMVKILVYSNAIISHINDYGLSPIAACSIYKIGSKDNYVNIVKLFCDNKEAYNAKLTFNELHQATIFRKLEIVEILVNHIDINSQDKKYKKTPLHIACENNSSDIVKFLISKKADPNILDINGRNPLHILCRNKNKNFSNIRTIINGFSGTFIRSTITRSKVDLCCKDNNGKKAINYFSRKSSIHYRFINNKMNNENLSMFSKSTNSFSDMKILISN